MVNKGKEDDYIDIAESSDIEVEVKKPTKRAKIVGSSNVVIANEESKSLYVANHTPESHVWSSQTIDTACLKLLTWYQSKGRVLPWREREGIEDGTFAYRVWVSEIMLQQTRVEAVVEYFNRWMGVFPTVEALSKADMDSVRQQWAGLGYYNRAASLHEGAKMQFDKYGCSLPPAEAWAEIKGIGPYTLGAIQTIVYGQSTPAIDTNVSRVVGRTRGMQFQTAVVGLVGSAQTSLDQLPVLDQGSDRERAKTLTQYTQVQYDCVHDHSKLVQQHDSKVLPNTGLNDEQKCALPWRDIVTNKVGRKTHMPYNSGNLCAELTQALIEQGALVCTAGDARCGSCPLFDECQGAKQVKQNARVVTVESQWESKPNEEGNKRKQKKTSSSLVCAACGPMYVHSCSELDTGSKVSVETPGAVELYGFVKKAKPGVLPYIASRSQTLLSKPDAVSVEPAGKPVHSVCFHALLQTRPFDKKSDKVPGAGFFYMPKYVVYAQFVRRPAKGVLASQWTLPYSEDSVFYRPELHSTEKLDAVKVLKNTSEYATISFDASIFDTPLVDTGLTDTHEFTHLIHNLSLKCVVINSHCAFQHELTFFGNTTQKPELTTTNYTYCWAPINLGDLRTTLGLSTQTLKAVNLLTKHLPKLQ